MEKIFRGVTKRIVRNCAALAVAAAAFSAYGASSLYAYDNACVSGNYVTFLGSENFKALVNAGIVSADPQNVKPSEAADGKVNIESVRTFKDKYVIVTFDAGFSHVSASDVKLVKYSDNWYAMKPETSDMKILGSEYTLNDEGKSVFIFRVADQIDGTRVKHSSQSTKAASIAENIKKAEAEGTMIETADNFLSWQLDNGGWDKSVEEQAASPWDGVSSKSHSGWSDENGEPCGTIDNNATYTQIYYIAAAYRSTGDTKYKESIERALEFVDLLQYPSGGLAQVYPPRSSGASNAPFNSENGGSYSNYVTFNDNAMINTLIMLEDISEGNYPFDSDVITDEYKAKTEKMLSDATDYILKSQIISQGKLTGWCAQHDPVTYEPRGGRAYELPSISGSESVPIIKFLMNRKEQTPEIENAWRSALEYFKESKVTGLKFVIENVLDKNGKQTYYENGKAIKRGYFVEDPKGELWYRFYEIDTNNPIFCGRDGVKKYDISEIEYERQAGYGWSGKWAKATIDVYDSIGYYPNKITAIVMKNYSGTGSGAKLEKGDSADVSSEV